MENSIKDLFDTLLDNETEKKIMRQILNNKKPDEIIKSFLDKNIEKDRND